MTVMNTHDLTITTDCKHHTGSEKRVIANYKVGNLVYPSMKNISLLKGRICKFAPKYFGPFAITRGLGEGATCQLDLGSGPIRQGVNPLFHALLLKPRVPNNDRQFLGRFPLSYLDSVKGWTNGSSMPSSCTTEKVLGANLN